MPGSTSVILSLAANDTVAVNWNVTDDADDVTGVLKLSDVDVKAGATIADELGIGAAGMACKPVTCTVRLESPADCAAADVVRPDGIVTVQTVPRVRALVFTVKATAAEEVPAAVISP
jgi:hypothetical protein